MLCFREENGLFGGFGEEISLFLFIFVRKAIYSWGLANKIVYSLFIFNEKRGLFRHFDEEKTLVLVFWKMRNMIIRSF